MIDMFSKIPIANRRFVIASAAKQSTSQPERLDCFAALAMTGNGGTSLV